MGQTYYSTEPAWTTAARTAFTRTAGNFEALRSMFSGTSAPTSPAAVAGQLWYDTTNTRIMLYDGSAWRAITGSTVYTDSHVITTSDCTVIANKATAITITLPAATGSGWAYTIINVGAGLCTVARDGSDTIMGETSQTLRTYESFELIDYAAGKWAIKG